MVRPILIVGAGMNGLACAWYLRRAGFTVHVLERMPVVGGAARNRRLQAGGRGHEFPLGATLLGQMQDFVRDDLRLAERIPMGPSPHPNQYWFGDREEPFRFDLGRARAADLGWNLDGLDAYEEDGGKVVRYIREGFRAGRPPSEDEVRSLLGNVLTDLWITGTASDLLDHYLRDDAIKAIIGKDVIESGPVSFHQPGTAFTLPLLDSGSVFNGRWGYVQGGMGRLLETVGRICMEAGISITTEALVSEIDLRRNRCRYRHGNRDETIEFEHVVFATDPMVAAKLTGDLGLIGKMSGKSYGGSSGKLIMLFDGPVRWAGDDGAPGYDSSLKFLMHQGSISEFEDANRRVTSGTEPFVRGYYEIYCEGAGQRMLGRDMGTDAIMAFFKHFSEDASSEELEEAKAVATEDVLRRTANGRERLVHAQLLAPADLTAEFFFTRGNIDHLTLTGTQNAWNRRHASGPDVRSYQFGAHANASYCGAGAYPCGSVSGTAGYMCANELLRSLKP